MDVVQLNLKFVNTGSETDFIQAYLTLLQLADYCVFYKLKVCGNPAASKLIGTIFPTAFAHFVSRCHILVVLAIFQTFSLLLYLLWPSVISDL